MRCGVRSIAWWAPRVFPRTPALHRWTCMNAKQATHQQVSLLYVAAVQGRLLPDRRECLQAVVRCPQSDDQLTISLPLSGRIRNLDR